MRPHFSRRLAVAVAIGAIIPACHASSSGSLPSTAMVATKALDSCDALQWRTNRESTTVAAGSSVGRGTWAGRVRRFGSFTLFVPDSARIISADTVRGSVQLGWPGCPEWCNFDAHADPDSSVGLEARITRIVAEQRRIDSAGDEFNAIDGPPEAFVTPNGRGYYIDNDCGDCAMSTLMFWKRGSIAVVGFGGDDQVPSLGRHLCEMEVVGKTFAWRE